jgi:hypothetical protein
MGWGDFRFIRGIWEAYGRWVEMLAKVWAEGEVSYQQRQSRCTRYSNTARKQIELISGNMWAEGPYLSTVAT